MPDRCPDCKRLKTKAEVCAMYDFEDGRLAWEEYDQHRLTAHGETVEDAKDEREAR